MKITDPEVLKLIRRANCLELEESIEEWDESDRNGMSDIEILAEEVDYRMSLYDEDTATSEDYKEAKHILRETKYGKEMPMIMPYFKPKYRESQIQNAKDSVNEHNRLRSLAKNLDSRGYLLGYN